MAKGKNVNPADAFRTFYLLYDALHVTNDLAGKAQRKKELKKASNSAMPNIQAMLLTWQLKQ